MDRRTFVKGGIAAGGLLAGAGLGIARLADATRRLRPDGRRQGAARRPFSVDPQHPNILVILVDQMRFPAWFSPTGDGSGLPPNLAALRKDAVSFSGHYTAANDCTPARSTLLTGLYTHQTGCMITGGSTLDPGFPTWGTMLREHGYRTRWYGKWHLTHRDGKWGRRRGERAMQRYGFHGGTYPSPNGAPGQGWRVDGHIARQFAKWFAEEGGAGPVVHDRLVRQPARHRLVVPVEQPRARGDERAAGRAVAAGQLRDARTADRSATSRVLQRSLQDTAAASFGPVPYEGPEAAQLWMQFLNLYGKLQREVDVHIGQVLAALEQPPAGRRQHGHRVHLRPRRVRRLARAARQGRGGLRGGAARAAAGQGQPRHAHAGAGNDAQPADLERRHRAAAADDRHRLQRLARRSALRAPRRRAPTSRRSSPTPTRPAART